MKKLLIASFLVCFTLTGFGQITNTAHDFSARGWNNEGEICIVCHTPHNADLTITDAPLWNHEITTATFQVYYTPTLDATVGQPNNNSKLCLSCHDGTVALDSYGGQTGSTSIGAGSSANFGTDLRNHHPVTFTYDAALALVDGELFDPTTTNSGLGGVISADMLFNTSLECGSCHDVHSNALGNFLIMSNDASALCLTCHDK